MTKETKSTLKKASTSWTVCFAAFVPVILAVAESLRDVLPIIKELLHGWNYVILAVFVSSIVTILRLRTIEKSGEIEQ